MQRSPVPMKLTAVTPIFMALLFFPMIMYMVHV